MSYRPLSGPGAGGRGVGGSVGAGEAGKLTDVGARVGGGTGGPCLPPAATSGIAPPPAPKKTNPVSPPPPPPPVDAAMAREDMEVASIAVMTGGATSAAFPYVLRNA